MRYLLVLSGVGGLWVLVSFFNEKCFIDWLIDGLIDGLMG